MKKYYFIHIRKTAGTSMRAFLRQAFGPHNICPELSQLELYGKHKQHELKNYLDQYQLVSGHYYNVNRHFLLPRITFTILRDPIARTLSEINHIANDKTDFLHSKLVASAHAESIFEMPEFDNALNNSQTRYLVANSGKRYADMEDEDRLGAALSFLRKIDFVGLTEQFETSLVLFAHEQGLPLPNVAPNLNRKITKRGPKKHENIPFLERIYANNQLDLRLYAAAQKLFDTACANRMRNLINQKAAKAPESGKEIGGLEAEARNANPTQ